MRFSLRRYFAIHPFASGVVATLAVLCGSATIVAAANHVHPFITGTIDYEDTTTGPIIEGVQSGGGIGIEGASSAGAPAGAIALQGFGTSTTLASVGVNGAVDGPGSTGLIGNANGTTGAASIGLEGFSANGEGIFAQSLNANFASLRSLDGTGKYDVRLSDVPNADVVTATLNANAGGAAVEGADIVGGSSSNVGVIGVTTTGVFGVEGGAGGNATAAVGGFATGSVDGVTGQSHSGNGVSGISTSGPGLLALSSTSSGASTESDNEDGLDGNTQNASATTLRSASGVFGLDGSTDGGTANFGVTGMSSDGTGVMASSTNGNGLQAQSSTGFAVSATSSGGNGGIFEGSNTVGIGILAFGSDGVVSGCTQGSGEEYIGKNSGGTANFFVDCTGSASSIVRTRHDMYADAITPRSTQATIEDDGEAQLVNGSAAVRLDPAFSDSISDGSPYLVFITPDGESRGLYVTQKTLQGFVVRENGGGGSNIAFDYRIVAKVAGDERVRMTLSARPPQAASHVDLALARPRDLSSMLEASRTTLASAIARRHAGAQKRQAAMAHLARVPRPLPMYEPHMGADGKLKPGKPLADLRHING